jgi:hypothetical protein
MSINQDLWSASLPNGEVRSGTLEQLKEACQSGHLSEGTLVRASSSDRWVKLADVLGGAAGGSVRPPASVAPAPRASVPSPSVAPQPVSPPVHGDAEPWQVRLANGEVRSGTRQQLAEAFATGHLDAEMLVLAAGAREWQRLGTVMERSEPSPARVVPSTSPPPPVDPPRASSPPPPTATLLGLHGGDDIWLMRLPDGQVRSGTRRQLEEAFRAGEIDEGALVLPDGASEWTKLGSVVARPLSVPAPASVVAREAPPAQAQPAAPDVAPEQAPASASERAPAPPAQDEPSPVQADPPVQAVSPPQADPPVQAEVAPPVASEPAAGDPLWQVKLTGKQLEEAVRVGLLSDDTLVLAAGSDQWVRFVDVRRSHSAPPGASLVVQSSPSAPASNGVSAELSAAPGASSVADSE